MINEPSVFELLRFDCGLGSALSACLSFMQHFQTHHQIIGIANYIYPKYSYSKTRENIETQIRHLRTQHLIRNIVLHTSNSL